MEGDDGLTYPDNDGDMRVHSHRWGCNLYATQRDAERSARRTLKPNRNWGPRRNERTFWIWRTEDGLYDWSAIPDRLSPWLRTATIVAEPQP